MEVVNLKITEEGIFWEIIDSGKQSVKSYRTNKDREGLFQDTDFWYIKQLEGTCDFQLKQKTRSGVKAAIKRYFGI